MTNRINAITAPLPLKGSLAKAYPLMALRITVSITPINVIFKLFT